MNPRIEKHMVLSTGHISLETSKILSDLDMTPVWGGPIEYGWWVHAEVDEQEIPEDLLTCIKYAAKAGCTWVRFDCDQPTCDDLPTYDW